MHEQVPLANGSLAEQVRRGLSAEPKRIPCCFFYDEAGSRIFEEICELPEYYLTRAERSILERSSAEIAACCPAHTALVEFGSGNSQKTRLLIESFLARRDALSYFPIDIASTILESNAARLREDYPALDVQPVAEDYDCALHGLAARIQKRVPGATPLVLWLGSSIGNMHRKEAAAFLAAVAAALPAPARLLIGIDLRKAAAVLEAAYDDSAGVTARFNLNLLERINAELGGDFDLAAFRHVAVYEADPGRVVLYLESKREQRARIAALSATFDFRSGERVHTENCYKYSLREIDDLAAEAGLVVERQWLDDERRVSLNLFRR